MKTYKQQASELGIWHSQYHTKSELKNAIKSVLSEMQRISLLNNKIESITGFKNDTGIGADVIMKFIKLTNRMPNTEEIHGIKCKGFKMWFSVVYMKAKTTEESVSFMGSEAYKIYHSL